MPPRPIEDLGSDAWSRGWRAKGKAIMVVGQGGRIHHVDPELAAWLGCTDMGANGFDLIPPETTEGAGTMNQSHGLESYTAWSPMRDAQNERPWSRWDGRRVEGLLVDAICRERDPRAPHVLPG